MIDDKHARRISKFLSLVLRHKPEVIQLELNNAGWADTRELIQKINASGRTLDFEILDYVVQTNTKKRFAFNEDKSKIRANQGHSLQIDHGFEASSPPEILYHGTGEKFLANILKEGLLKKERHHVHLSMDIQTAKSVGQRHGKPAVLEVLAMKMRDEGYLFYCSENNVWLTDTVPPQYLNLIDI